MKPTVLSPSSRFRVPHQNGLARSPSRSPNRQHVFMSHDLDPLLSNLSPTSTLEALEATEAIDSEGTAGQSLLHDSAAAASTSERALGIRAALAGKKLKEWHRELTAWPWPESSTSSRNGFHMPSQEEKSRDRWKRNHEGCLDKALLEQERVGAIENNEETEYWGSLPARLVQDYEHRVDMIRDDMEALGLEDLKDYVRDAHLPSNPRRLSRGGSGTEYIHLDDFTAVITATIMHALPTISRLNSLLMTWSIRLVILRQIPDFLKLLEHARFSMVAAWDAVVNVNAATVKDDFEIARTALHSKRVELESNIFELGRKLDAMLDILEGREDTIPEEWIDGMENIEAEFSDWAVESEKRVMEEEWKFSQSNCESDARSNHDTHSSADNAEILANVHENVQDTNSYKKKPSKQTPESSIIQPLQPSRSPAASFGYDGEVNGRGEHLVEVAPPELGDNILDMNSNPSNSQSKTSQGESQLWHQTANDVSKVKAADAANADSSHDMVVQNEEDDNASSSEVVSNVAKPSDPMYKSPLTLEPFGLNPLMHILQTAIIDHDGLSASAHPISDSNMLENNQSKNYDDLTLNELSNNGDAPTEPRNLKPLEPFGLNPLTHISQTAIIDQDGISASAHPISDVNMHENNQPSDDYGHLPLSVLSNNGNAPIEPRTREPLSVPADIASLDICDLQLPKNTKRKGNTAVRPAPLSIKQLQPNMENEASSDISPDTSVPGSGTSEYFSNMSSPEIQEASMAEYFENPVEVTTPSRGPSTPLDMFSRRSSLLIDRAENGSHDNGSMPSFSLSLNHRRRASSFAPGSSIPESTGFEDEKPIHRQNVKSHVRVRSASLKSFEIIPRSEVRNVTIRRSDSYQSAVPRQLSLHSEDKTAVESSTSRLLRSDTVTSTDPGVAKPTSLNLDMDDRARSELADEVENELESFGLATPIESSPVPRAKPRHRFENVLDLSPGSSPAKLQRRKAIQVAAVKPGGRKSVARAPIATSLTNPEDQLEARISSILTEIPGHIRLKSGPEPDAPDVLPSDTFSDPKKPNSRSPATRPKRPPTSVPSSPLTLTPAHSKSSRLRGSGGDPEIKLYHLHHSGKDVPVKLFVRLVGEGGERVMVRIGGGWADLGEYLKEYASHHGRRSISDGRFEIQGLPQSQSNIPLSTLAGITRPTSSSASRPGTPATRPSSSLSFRFPQHAASSSADLNAPVTPENPPLRQFEPTPGSTETTHSSLRPSSRLSSTDEDSPLGLAGPKTRRKEVSPSKQAWVDEMLDQARKASAEKKGGAERDFGDLGIVGSTKRVFMRSRRDG